MAGCEMPALKAVKEAASRPAEMPESPPEEPPENPPEATPASPPEETPSLVIADASAAEGAGTLTFEVRLSGAAGSTRVTMDYATADGSATGERTTRRRAAR